MFFWNKLKPNTLLNELRNLTAVKRVFIAVAFCSDYGAQILHNFSISHNLAKDKIEIVLGRDFNTEKPFEILSYLQTFSTVKIRKTDDFHPKAYIFTHINDNFTLITGSGNLTKNGIETNLEIFNKTTLDRNDKAMFEGFIYAANFNTVQLNSEILKKYEEIQTRLQAMNAAIKGKSNLLNYVFNIESDPLVPDSLKFDNHLFLFEDYETFFPKNATLTNDAIMTRRKNVKEKLMSLKPFIEEFISNRNYNLFVHWDVNHITSLIYPTVFNKYYVGWLGIRFGKSQAEIANFKSNWDEDNDNEYGFQKHACLQYSVFDRGFWVGLFHSVPNGAIDRYFLHQELTKNEVLKSALSNELFNIADRGYSFFLANEYIPISSTNYSLLFDKYMLADQDGFEFTIGKLFQPDDYKINRTNIGETINTIYAELIPLYKLVAQRYN